MRVLVCGGRNYNNYNEVARVLNNLYIALDKDNLTIIDGGARGADTLANTWAISNGVKTERFFADWSKHGKSAGPRRNKQMLEEGKPSMIIAFPGGKGTANMVSIARKADVYVYEIKE